MNSLLVSLCLTVCVGLSLAGRGGGGGRFRGAGGGAGGYSDSSEEDTDYPDYGGQGGNGGTGGVFPTFPVRRRIGGNGNGNTNNGSGAGGNTQGLAELRTLAAQMNTQERDALLELFLSGQIGCDGNFDMAGMTPTNNFSGQRFGSQRNGGRRG